MMKHFIHKGAKCAAVLAVAFSIAPPVNAGYVTYQGLSIAKVRAVGDYEGTMFDNTLEVWPTTPLPVTAGSNCTATFRFFIDSKNKHLVTAVYLALSLGRKIDVTVDDGLPLRSGACEASYLDVSGQ